MAIFLIMLVAVGIGIYLSIPYIQSLLMTIVDFTVNTLIFLAVILGLYLLVKLAESYSESKKKALEEKEKKEKERVRSENIKNTVSYNQMVDQERHSRYISFLNQKSIKTKELSKRRLATRLSKCKSPFDTLIRIVCKAHGIKKTCEDVVHFRNAFNFNVSYNYLIPFFQKCGLTTQELSSNQTETTKDVILALLDGYSLLVKTNSYFLTANIDKVDTSGSLLDVVSWVMGTEVDSTGKIYMYLYTPEVSLDDIYVIDVKRFEKITSNKFIYLK